MVDWHGKDLIIEEQRKFSELTEEEKKQILKPFSTIPEEIKQKIRDNPKQFLEEKKQWKDSWYPQIKDVQLLRKLNTDWQNQILYAIACLEQGNAAKWRTDKMLKVMETKNHQEVQFMLRLIKMKGGAI